MRFIESLWYRDCPASWLLLPLSLLYRVVAKLRRCAFAAGWFATARLEVPVIVVGNINVGGSGKTPLVIWLVNSLSAGGWRPGVVSRGYGGSHRDGVLRITSDTRPAQAGDEPVLIARRTGRPVAIARRRAEAARRLVDEAGVDIIVTDDGLQHYALQRDVEIAVVDGRRGLGNRRILPAGPLREPPERLREVDFVFINGDGFTWPSGFRLHLNLLGAQNLTSNERRPLASFCGQTIHAVAGIGHPQRFFDALRSLGLQVIAHPFRDHHRFDAADLRFEDNYAVLMTEKDAVKCRVFAPVNCWAVAVDAVFDAGDQPVFDAIMLCL